MYLLKIVPNRSWEVASSVTDTGQGVEDEEGKSDTLR